MHGYRLKIELRGDGRQGAELEIGRVIELHVNFLHPEHQFAVGGEAAAVVGGGAAQHAVGQLGTVVEGNHVLAVFGDGVGGTGAADLPVHARLAAPGGQGPLPGGGWGRAEREVGSEAEGDAARGIQGNVVGALQQVARGTFHVGEGVHDGKGACAFCRQLVGSRDAHLTRARRAAAGRRRHPHLNAGIGPGEVVGLAGFHAGGPAVVGVLELDKPAAPAAAKAVAVDGEHGPGAGGERERRQSGDGRGQRAALRRLGGAGSSQGRVGPQHLARLAGEAGYFLVKSSAEGRVGTKRLSRRVLGWVEFDEALLAAHGREGGGAGSGPGRGGQEKDALLAGAQPQGVGQKLLVEPQPAAFGDEAQAGGVGHRAFQQRKYPQPVPGKQPLVRGIPEALRVEHFALHYQRRLLDAAGGLKGQQQAVGFG